MSSRSFAPRLTRGEYWILNSLVEHPHSLCLYGYPDRYLWRLLNRQPHGLSEDELVLTLLGLFNAGWIEGKIDSNADGDSKVPFVPWGTAICAALQSEFDDSDPEWPCLLRTADPSVIIRLTPEGAAVWEAFAEPRWEDFLEVDWDLGGSAATMTVRTIDRDRGRSCLRCCEKLIEAAPETAVWKPVAPFPVTYWKTLPIGFVAEVPSKRRGAGRDRSREEAAKIRDLEHEALRSSRHLRHWRAWE